MSLATLLNIVSRTVNQSLSSPKSKLNIVRGCRALISTQCHLSQRTSEPGGNVNSNTEGNLDGSSSSNLKAPVITSRDLQFPVKHTYPRLAWLESMDSLEGSKIGMLDLHQDVFAVYPRIDILHQNVHWQRMYRHIDYSFEKSRAELRGGGRKPWPQKGTGRARHGSIRSPLWIKGAKAHGPRGPKSYFHMLPRHIRGLGLRIALSCKYAQNDLIIVDNFDISSSDPEFLADMADVRFWGYSVLFIDDTDIMPKNFAAAVKGNRGFSMMPAYGLNVYSMLKHETLVMTLAAVEKVERKLLEEMHSPLQVKKFVNNLRPEDFFSGPKAQDDIMYRKWTQPLQYD